MARTRWIWDKDLQSLVEIGEGSNRGEPEKRVPMMGVMSDIKPYQAVGTDIAIGAPPIIGGRRQHREFLRRNDYIEVGNEKPIQRKAPGDYLCKKDRQADIVRAWKEATGRL